MNAQKIKIQSLPSLDVISLESTQSTNEHGYLKISGYIDAQQEDEVLRQSVQGNLKIKIMITDDEDAEHNWFEGVLIDFKVDTENARKLLTLFIATGTYLMDLAPHTRSFQSESITYGAIFSTLHKGYDDGAAFFNIDENSPIEHFIMQYLETDWQFAKRMASRFNTVLIPDAKFGFPVYYVGVSDRSPKIVINTKTYIMDKQVGTFLEKQGKGLKTMYESDVVLYKIRLRDIYSLGDIIKFNGETLCINKIESKLEGADLYHIYTLAPTRAFQVPVHHNANLIGLSLSGVVTSVEKDSVTISFNDDENLNDCGSIMYPFATVYSSEDGTGWYFMPEVSDAIRVTFPTEEEKNAFVLNSVHVNGKEGSERSNPDFKSLMNKQRKEILFTPSSITITNNAGMSIELNDNKGISITSNKAINIESESLVDISSTSSIVRLTAPQEISFKQGNTEMNLKEKMSFKGAQIRLD